MLDSAEIASMGKNTTATKNQQNWSYVCQTLATSNNESEVRLLICDALGISSEIKILGSTDGIWNDILFEFKYDKRFKDGAKWNRSAYGALAQAIYYCRKILNFEIEGIDKIPHSIAVVDKSGAFLLDSGRFEWLLHFDPEHWKEESSRADHPHAADYNKLLESGDFSWDLPPSNQSKALTDLLIEKRELDRVDYFDFTDPDHFDLFVRSSKNSKGKFPRISITQSNFIHIFELWMKAFAPEDARRRDWADRFVIDLRCQFTLNSKRGTLSNDGDEWRVSVDTYEAFWSLYKRPPEKAVDEYIATNKDLLYDVDDQNNHGDFYTPIKLVGLAQRLITRHLEPKTKKSWWDPAAGGGNLFFRFNQAQNVILSTKFKNDCDGLRNNPSVRSSLVLQLDFINEQVEKDLTLQKEWQTIKTAIGKSDELVFFLNPPFDDQAESRGTNESLPENFLSHADVDKVSPRSLRALHTRFFYRILSIAEALEKPVWVAAFSKVAWVVGPDSRSFYDRWSSSFSFKDGFLVSSKVFNGTKEEWPCLFSLWHYDPKKKPTRNNKLTLNVYDSSYEWIGQKILAPFDSELTRLSEIAKLDRSVLGKREDYITVPPLDNEYEICKKPYEDSLPKNALGYFRMVANDVYNSAKRVQFFSSIFGPSNHNGVPVLKENFSQCLAVHGIRKSVRRTWLNDKDEFYLPKKLSAAHESLLRKAAVFALVDGGYASSIENIKYKSKQYSFDNEFFILSNLELRNLDAEYVPAKDPYAVSWLKSIKSDLTNLEEDAIKAAKELIKASFKSGLRAKGDPKRQLWRGNAGIRQLINGLLDFKNIEIPKDLKDSYDEYLKAKEKLRAEIERTAYKLEVLMPFEENEETQVKPLTKKELSALAKELKAKVTAQRKGRA